MEPRTWTLNEWYEQNSLWRILEGSPGSAFISPAQVEAYSAHHWVVTYTAGKTLGPGSHVAVEVPAGWTIHLGRPLHGGRQLLVCAGEVNPGYAAWAEAETEGEAKLALAISDCTRFTIVDVVVVEGEVRAGERLWIHLGSEEGSKVRCQWFAQETPLAMGVDLDGDGNYRPVNPPPSVTVTGARADKLRIVAPATAQPGEDIEAFIQVVDGYGANPAVDYRGDIKLQVDGPIAETPPDITIAPKGAWESHVALKAGLANGAAFIRACDMTNGLAGVSNPTGVGFCKESEQIVFGDLHGQTYVSIGTGSLDEYYTWARDVERLDFCAIANHYGGRMDFDNLPQWEKERREALDALWPVDRDTSNKYYAPGRFVTFISFEWGNRTGHRNVYYRGDDGIYIRGQDGMSPYELWQMLESKGYRALTIPHHPKFCGVTDWTHRNDDFQRLVEICSAWGISEAGGEHSVRHALALGHRLGFVGGTDTHFGQPGRSPHFFGEGGGLTAAYVPEKTRPALWDALYNRRCYATTGARILLRFAINGQPMGSEITAREANVEASVIGTVPEYSVDLVRNGSVVYTHDSDGFESEISWSDPEPWQETGSLEENGTTVNYYYLRVRQADRHVAWSSPVWVRKEG